MQPESLALNSHFLGILEGGEKPLSYMKVFGNTDTCTHAHQCTHTHAQTDTQTTHAQTDTGKNTRFLHFS